MKRITSLGLALIFVTSTAHAQFVVKLERPSNLATEWNQIVENALDQTNEGYAIGYMLPVSDKMGGVNIHGSDSKSLAEVITGGRADNGRHQTAIIVSFENGARLPRSITSTSMSSQLQFKSKKLFWLGEVSETSSLELLGRWVDVKEDGEFQEDLQTAIGVHLPTKRQVALLEMSARGGASTEIRKKASFWLGQTDREDALDILVDIVENDPSREVQKDAVFAISLLELESALDALVAFTRHKDREVKKNAIFWISQMASGRVVDTLVGVVASENDPEVQGHAVFAISQLEPDQSIPLLIGLAKNHPRTEVRKKAIFWLGQMDDERATEAIISLARS